MKILNITLLGISLLSLLHSCGQSREVSIEEADKIYFQMKPRQALELYQKIWSDTSSSPDDKARAGRKLATMHWLLYNNASQSFEVLEALEDFGHELSRCYQVWARILAEESRYDQAIIMAKKSVSSAASESVLYRAQISLIKAVYTKYHYKVLSNEFDDADFETNEFTEAYEIIQNIVREKPGDILAAELYLGMSILADQPQEAYVGWLSFFRADKAGNVHPTLSDAQEKLKSAWLSTDSIAVDSEKVVLGLSESGFMKYAGLVAKKEQIQVSANPRISDLIKYHDFLQNVQRITIQFYRDEVAGNASESDYQDDLRTEGKKLWSTLSWDGKAPKFKDERFIDELRQRFNTVAVLMDANGHYGLSLGYVVLDEERHVKQYDKEGSLRYIAIDHMLSNGYSSWFWDGRAEIGGWAPDESSILQVRSAYNKGPISAWLKVSDSVEIKKTLERIEEKSSKDDQIANDDPYAYLPGLASRIDFNAVNELLADLRSEGLEGPELRATFINTYEKLTLESSIFAHEGRHAIDKKYNKGLGSEEMEFRAKLSEIYFAERPFLAIDAVISPNIGDGTSHGDSNKRVMIGLVNWMEENSSEIEGFDATRPYLPQLDLLTDQQLREAVKSFDPLAN